MTHKETAEAYVRSKLPELMELSFGCEIRSSPTISQHDWEECGRFSRGTYTFGRIETNHGLVLQHEMLELKPKWFEIIGHPIQLQHWLRVLHDECGDWDSICLRDDHISLCIDFDADHWIDLSTNTGQPATPADYQAFNEITGNV